MKYRYREQHEMKDSGVEWLGMIPKEWELKKMKYILKERKEKNDPIKTDYILSLMIEKGVIPYSEKGNVGNKAKEDLSQYKIARPKDIIINSMNIIIGAVGLSNYFGVLSPVYYTLFSTGEDVNPYFYYKVFQSKGFQKSLLGLGNGILDHRMRIPMEKLGNVFLPFISRENQQKIADFLDKKCEEFDSVIAKKEILINKLEEAKKSLISEVVTGKVKVIQKENGEYGIIKRETHEMKNSGVEWLGMIPKEWEVKKLGYLYSFKNGVNADAGKYGKGIKFINVKEVINNRILTYDMIPNLVDISKELIKENIVKNGDILLNRTSETAEEIGMVTVYKDINPIVFGGFVIKGSQKSKTLIDDFKKYCFSSLEIRSQMISYASGSIRKNISQSNLKDIYLTYPKIDFQKIIGKYLNEKSSQFDIVIGKQKAIIEKLKLAKQSLISEAVTGKIEVL